MIGFDYRILHSASNINEYGKPLRNLDQKEKKVIWPTFGKRNFFTESIYQYTRFIRKDFCIKKYVKPEVFQMLKLNNKLPDTYENLSEKHIRWCKKNLMYAAEFDDLIFEKETSKKILNYRKKLVDLYSKDNKYSLQKIKQKELIDKYDRLN